MKNKFQSLESIITTILEKNNLILEEKNSIPMFDDYRSELEKYTSIDLYSEADDFEASKNNPLRNKVYREIKNTFGKKVLKNLMDKYFEKGQITEQAINSIYANLYKNYFSDVLTGVKTLYSEISTKFDNKDESKIQNFIKHWMTEVQNDKTITSPRNFLLRRLSMASPEILKNYFENYSKNKNRTDSPAEFGRELKKLFDRTDIEDSDGHISSNIEAMLKNFDDNFSNTLSQDNQESSQNNQQTTPQEKSSDDKENKKEDEKMDFERVDENTASPVYSNSKSFKDIIWSNKVYEPFIYDMISIMKLNSGKIDKQMFNVIRNQWGANAVGFFESNEDIINFVFEAAKDEIGSSDIKNMILQQQHDYVAYIIFLHFLAGLTGIAEIKELDSNAVDNQTPETQDDSNMFNRPHKLFEEEVYDLSEGITSALTSALGRTFKRLIGYDTFSKISKKGTAIGNLLYTTTNMFLKDPVFRKRINFIDMKLKCVDLDLINSTDFSKITLLSNKQTINAQKRMKEFVIKLTSDDTIPLMIFKNNTTQEPFAKKLGRTFSRGINSVKGNISIGGGQSNNNIGIQ